MDEENTIAQSTFSPRAVLDLRSLPLVIEQNAKADRGVAASRCDRKSPGTDESSVIALNETLNYLLRQVQIRRIRMTAVKCDRYRVKQLLVPSAELIDLEFRITPRHRIASVGLWSRSRNTLMWESPQFLRADIARVWPTPKKETAAVSDVLHHLQAVMTLAVPLTKADAQRRCLAEVPNASSAGFKKAWALLDPSRKRRRGEHGATGVLKQETSG
jgi:hypothetical protein